MAPLARRPAVGLAMLLLATTPAAAQSLRLRHPLDAGHTAHVSHIEYSRDGKRLLSRSMFQTRLWDVASGACLAAVPSGRSALSADGKRLLCIDHNMRWNVADVATRQIAQRKLDWGPLLGTAVVTGISPDGKWRVNGHRDGTIELWDAESDKRTWEIAGSPYAIEAIQFDPAGKTLIVSTAPDSDRQRPSGQIRQWDVTTGKERGEPIPFANARWGTLGAGGKVAASVSQGYTEKKPTWSVRCLATGKQLLRLTDEDALQGRISPDERVLLLWRGGAKWWDLATGKVIGDLKGKGGDAPPAFSPDGKRLATADGKDVVLWEVATAKKLATLSGHKAAVAGLRFSPDGKTLLSHTNDYWSGEAWLWDGTSGKPILTLAKVEGSRSAFSADDQLLATFGAAIQLWEPATGKRRREITFSGALEGVFSPDGKCLVVRKGRELYAFDVGDGRRRLLGEEEKDVQFLGFALGGQMLVSATSEAVKLRSVADGKLLDTLPGRSLDRRAVAVSPNGRLLAWKRWPGAAAVRDLKTGKDLGVWPRQHAGSIRCVAFSPAQGLLASGDSHGCIMLWDAARREHRATLAGHGYSVGSLRFSADGKVLASRGTDDGSTYSYRESVRVWDVTTGKDRLTVPPARDDTRAFALSADGQQLAVARGGPLSIARRVQLWNTLSGKERVSFQVESVVTALAFSPDGKTLAHADRDHTIRLLDLASGKTTDSWPRHGHHGGIAWLGFSKDGRTLTSTSWDRTANVWDVKSGRHKAALAGFLSYQSYPAALTSDGKTLAALEHGFNGFAVSLWDVASKKRTARLGPGHMVRFSPDDKQVATVDGRDVTLWEVSSGKRRFAWSLSPGVDSVAFDPDGHHLAGCAQFWDRDSGRYHLVVWDTRTGQPTATIKADYLRPLALTRGGKLLIVGSVRGVSFYELPGGKLLHTVKMDGWPRCIVISPDGKRLAVGDDGGRVTLLDVATRKPLASVRAHAGSIYALAFSPDGQLLASGDSESSIHLWEATQAP